MILPASLNKKGHLSLLDQGRPNTPGMCVKTYTERTPFRSTVRRIYTCKSSGPSCRRYGTQRYRNLNKANVVVSWWRHQMETSSALLAFCAGNSPVTGEFPAQRPVTRSFDVFFDLRLNKRLGIQS